MNLRSPNHSLREFSESVGNLEILEILDVITDELGIISRQCKQLGFGYKPKKGSKIRKYYEDLNFLVLLFTNTDLPKFREGFVEEANSLLRKMSQNLISLKKLKL